MPPDPVGDRADRGDIDATPAGEGIAKTDGTVKRGRGHNVLLRAGKEPIRDSEPAPNAVGAASRVLVDSRVSLSSWQRLGLN